MTKKIEFAKDYRFAHGGVYVTHYRAGQFVENPSEELAKQAKADGVLKAAPEKQLKEKDGRKTVAPAEAAAPQSATTR